MTKPFENQIGGDHYLEFEIQPAEFIQKNALNFLEGNVVKRMCRHSECKGLEDLEKAIDEIKKIAFIEYGVDLDNKFLSKSMEEIVVDKVKKVSGSDPRLILRTNRKTFKSERVSNNHYHFVLDEKDFEDGFDIVDLPIGATWTTEVRRDKDTVNVEPLDPKDKDLRTNDKLQPQRFMHENTVKKNREYSHKIEDIKEIVYTERVDLSEKKLNYSPVTIEKAMEEMSTPKRCKGNCDT